MKQKSEIKRTGPELLKRLLRQREMSVFLIILLVVAIVAIVNPKFIQPSNMKSIALSVATDGLLSIGLTLALILGGIELSVGGVAAMTCVIAGQMALMGVNIWVACLAALAAGTAFSLMIYNPVTGVIHNRLLFTLTPTGCSFLASGCIYWLLCNLPGIRRYVRRDLAEVPDTRPFDRFREPPRQNLAAMPFIWLWCCLVTARAGLKIRKKGMKGLKPPFLVLATHHSFTDFYVTPLVLFPHRANYVSELE